WEQYDYTIRTNTLEGPGGDAAIVRVKETGTAIAMSLDGNQRYTALSPREGTKLIVAECCRNLATVGALPVGATNNLNFGNPERPEIMAQLVECIEGMAEACRFFETPITGGNVSLYNETLGEAIFPSPVMGIVGLMKTAAPIPAAFRNEGRAVVLLGGVGEASHERFGGTQYAKVIMGAMWGLPPALDMDYEKRVHDAMRQIAAEGLAESAHDLSDGGLAVALAEASTAGIAAKVDLKSDLAPQYLLFHEGPSRILVSTTNAGRVQQIAAAHGVEAPVLGGTMKEELQISRNSEVLVRCPVAGLRERQESSLAKTLS
ncbi:MAG TPA: AIR synthase related protein, partial [Bryobacteraceae bacterium]|nr:AIR synthase related protein [Bryobacteraceae bacterium]